MRAMIGRRCVLPKLNLNTLLLISFFLAFVVVSDLDQAIAINKDESSRVLNMSKFAVLPKLININNASQSAGAITKETAKRRVGWGKANGLASAVKDQRRFTRERELRMQRLYNYTRPMLDEILKGENIIGSPQFLLDFSIVGFGKCGTSSLMHWLASHPETQVFREEQWHLITNRPDSLVRKLYQNLKTGPWKRGYKCPGEVTLPHVMEYYRTYFPKTKLIIGLRHPIPWFQSLYNFRIQNLETPASSLPLPNELIGRCYGNMRHTCTEKGNFAFHLISMGKQHYNGTRPTTDLERDIVGHFKRSEYDPSTVKYMDNPVFLFDLDQLKDKTFQTDMATFLGLSLDKLPAMRSYSPGRTWEDAEQQARDKRKINICDAEFIPLRAELMRLARQNSLWIRQVFLDLPGVHVSSRSTFEQAVETWMKDPCEEAQPAISK
jgi:hypothetical protein